MPITLIAAVSENNCIGKHGTLPWHIPEDLAHFKQLTHGHIVIMGRKTWESIPKQFRPLPHRTNVVISSNPDYAVPPDVQVYTSLDEALRVYTNEDVYIIGGASLYTASIDRADALEITHVSRHVDGDTFFPHIERTHWKEVSRTAHDGFAFVRYERL